MSKAAKKLQIVVYPDPVLKKQSAPVTEFGPDLASLAERMFELMHADKGVGLAAPQVGLSIRMFVCNSTGEPENNIAYVNPRFLELSGAEEKDEGCLSLPGVTVAMRRATHAVMEAYDLQGNKVVVTGSELLARIWQHETDHLDGKLIIDHMSASDEIVNRRAIKQMQADYRERRKKK